MLDKPIEVEEYDVEDEEDLAEEEPSAELEVPAAEVEPTIAAEVEPLADAEPASVLEPLTSPESLTTDEPLAEPESFTASESLAEPEPLVMPELLTESEPLSEPDEDLTESEQLATEPTEAGSVTEADAPDPVMPDEEADEEPEEEAEAAPEPVEPPVLPTEDDIPDFPSAEPAAVPAISSGGHAKVEDPDYVAPSLTERVLGCFLGGALGDSLGSDLEFKTAQEITAHFGPEGPRGLREAYGVRGAITDDTQMTLFTAEGLIRGSIAQRTLGTEDPLPEVQLAYQRWLHTQGVEWAAAAGWFISDHPAPDGWLIEVPGLFSTRGPGKTVFRALSGFGDGEQAGSFTHKINDSKGCGGVMRAAPVALYSADPAEVFELAARTAALTHTHPAGFHSAGALAVIVQQALLGRSLDDGVWLALQVLETWPDHDETTAMLKLAVELAGSGVPSPGHVEEVLGGGWVGEEALAIAVCAALVGGDDVELALRVAAHHSGDSDSTAAICGNIVGALLGVSALPVDWLADLELRDVIEQMALDCVVEFGVGAFHPETPDEARPVDQDWNDRYPVRPVWTERPGSRSVEQPTRRLRAVAADDPEPLAEFPAPKPSPRRINGVMPGGSLYEGDR